MEQIFINNPAIVLLLILILLAGILLLIVRRRRKKRVTAAAAPKPSKSVKKARKSSTVSKTGSAAKTSTSAVTAAPPSPNRRDQPMVPISEMEPPVVISDKIRILIVDDNRGTRENVSRLLYFENDLEVIGQAVNGRQGIEMAVELKPHIVLMDINMPDTDGITATREMSVKVPYSQVIIMSVQAEQHYMKQAMAAGARDFQPKPFTSDELISCIRRVYERALPHYRHFEGVKRSEIQRASQPQVEANPSERSAPIIAVYGPKGGIGTSTIAVNLAVAFQQKHGEVALFDTDLQFGDISVHLNTRPSRTISDAIHQGELDTELLPELMLAHNSGLKLLLAPPQPELADAVTPAMLASTLKELKKRFKLVVVDTGTQLNDKTLNVLDHVDYILLITTPELPAIKSAKLFLELAPQLELASDRLEVVINRSTLPGGIAPDKVEKVLKLSQSHHIPYDPRIHTAINRGVSVIQQDSGAPSARAIEHVAALLWRKFGFGETKDVAVAKELA